MAQKVASGRYDSESEVVQHGLRLLREYEAEQEKLAELRREIAVGMNEADEGQTAPLSARDTLARARTYREALMREQP